MRVVFALTSNGRDGYAAMTRLVVASLNATNPTIKITIACDDVSWRELKRTSNPIDGIPAEWVTIETPAGSPEFRNRFVKTSLRKVLSGPFLFLDSDVFVRGSLADLAGANGDVCGVRNHCQPNPENQVWAGDRATLAKMGWEVTGTYLNGGVLYFGDNEAARRFAARWHENWLLSVAQTGGYRDQPALNVAVKESGANVVILPDKYNAQFNYTPSSARDALIWHYYASGGGSIPTKIDDVLGELMAKGDLNDQAMTGVLRSSYPWRADSFLKDFAAKRLLCADKYTGWQAAALTNRLGAHLAAALQREVARGTGKVKRRLRRFLA